MDFDEYRDYSETQPVSEINMIPLIDVMLVLLILFIITAPLFTPHAVKIDLPQAASEVSTNQPAVIALSIDAKGQLFWNDEPINYQEFQQRLTHSTQLKIRPELQLWADKMTPYQQIAQIMSMAHRAGITRLGLVTRP